jgi:histidinol-phosphate/aromatic aminotransferase/cobyric acid decarboxylase-like protein
MKLNKFESEILEKIKIEKSKSGTHSPSIFTLASIIPELDIKIDACFLSNPYATNLFSDFMRRELIETGKMRDFLEYYPSQNRFIAEIIGNTINITGANIFVGNGAIEIIQAVLHRFVTGKLLVAIPTFSSYYEFVNDRTDVEYYALSKAEGYILDVDNYIGYVKKLNIDSIVLINPNNPDGNYISLSDIQKILEELSYLKNIIIDESFIHFAYEDEDLKVMSAANLIDQYQNLIVIKSMSKDFGIAGIRAGYSIMSKFKVNQLLSNGYLWNSSGLSEYFFNLYAREDFQNLYNEVRKRYIIETKDFIQELRQINGIKVYGSKSNFVLFELLNNLSAEVFNSKLLLSHGIYSRLCYDKVGLDGQFIRIASRGMVDNVKILNAIKLLLNESLLS